MTLRITLFILAVLAAIVLSGQTFTAPQTVRSVDTVTDLVALNPKDVLSGGKGSVLVRGRSIVGDWGGARDAYYLTNQLIPTNLIEDFVFNTTNGGQWVFPDRSNAVYVAFSQQTITSRWVHTFRSGLVVDDGQTITLGGEPRSSWPVFSDADTLNGYDGLFYRNRTNHFGTQNWTTIHSTPNTLAGYGITDPVWTALNDGPGSGMDADLLDGQHGSYYLDRGNHFGTQNWTTIHSTPNTLAGYGITDPVWTALNDGPGSGMDADLLDGQHGAHFLSRGSHTGEQAISTVTGLQSALDGKSDIGHEHDASDVTSGTFDPTRLGSGTSDTDTVLFGNAGDPGIWRQIDTNDVGGLQAWMSTKSDTNHTHAASAITSGVLAPERLGTGTPTAGLVLFANGSGSDPYWGTAPTGPAGTNGIPDAPSDSKFYGRKNTSWVNIDIADVYGMTLFGSNFVKLASTAYEARERLELVGISIATIDSPAKYNVRVNTTGVGTPRHRLNLIGATGMAISLSDDSANDETDVTVGLGDRDWGDFTSSSSGTVFNIDADAVGSSEIAANAVGNSEMADSAVGSAEIIDGSVNTSDLTDSAVTSDKLNDLSVTTSKIVGGAVTYAKIQNVTPGKLLGGANDGVSSAPEEINVHSGLIMEGNNLMVDWSAAPAGDAPFAWVKFTSSIPDPCCDDEPVQAIISASGVSEVRRITVDGLYRLTLTSAQPAGDFKEVQTAYISASADFRRAVVLSDGFYVSSGTTLYVYVDGGVPDSWKFMLRIFNR